MGQCARGFEHWKTKRETAFCYSASEGEKEARDRIRRQLRARMRQMEPTLLLTPRWSKPRDFLESLSLEMAVAEPAISCRSTTFVGLRGHQLTEARQRVLTALAELSVSHWADAQVPYVASNAGFEAAVQTLLLRAQEKGERIALMAEGVEHLHVDVLSALSEAWSNFYDSCDADRMVVLMLAGSACSSRFTLEGATQIDLPDYARKEAMHLLSPNEESGAQGELALEFSGGVPGFVGPIAQGAQSLGGLPYSSTGIIRLLGPVEQEVRQVLDLLSADPLLADRIEGLACLEEDAHESCTDDALLSAGILRELRPQSGERRVALRAPLLAAMLG